MKLGRFIVDTHVHAQRFAAGKALEQTKVETSRARYGDLANVIRLLSLAPIARKANGSPRGPPTVGL